MQLKFTSLSSVARSFIVVAACVAAPSVAMANSTVIAWGYDYDGACGITASKASGVSAIASGAQFSISLNNGQVFSWGGHWSNSIKQMNDEAYSGVSAIAGGYSHTIALKNGTIYAWGLNDSGQCAGTSSSGAVIASVDNPYWFGALPALKINGVTLTGVSAIAGGGYHTIALKDGAVLAMGRGKTNQTNGGTNKDQFGQCIIPAAATSGVTAIAGGFYHTIALKDGAVLAWGAGTTSKTNGGTSKAEFGQCIIPAAATSGVTAIAGGGYHTIALKDGAVLAWGSNSFFGQCTIPAAATSGVTAIAGGGEHTIALKDGAVLAWGRNLEGQCNIPVGAQSGVTAIAGGDVHTIAITSNDTASYIAGIAALTSQNATLTSQITSLNSQITVLTSQNTALTSENASLNSQITALTSQNTALTSQNTSLTSQNTSLTSQITVLTSQNTSLTSQNSSLNSQNTLLTSQNTSLNSQIASLNSQNTSLDSQIAALTSENATLNSENTALTSQIAALTSENAALTSENATLDSENTALTTQLNCGDLDGNGEVNGADVGLQLINYGPCVPPEAAPEVAPEVAPQIKGTRKESPR